MRGVPQEGPRTSSSAKLCHWLGASWSGRVLSLNTVVIRGRVAGAVSQLCSPKRRSAWHVSWTPWCTAYSSEPAFPCQLKEYSSVLLTDLFHCAETQTTELNGKICRRQYLADIGMQRTHSLHLPLGIQNFSRLPLSTGGVIQTDTPGESGTNPTLSSQRRHTCLFTGIMGLMSTRRHLAGSPELSTSPLYPLYKSSLMSREITPVGQGKVLVQRGQLLHLSLEYSDGCHRLQFSAIPAVLRRVGSSETRLEPFRAQNCGHWKSTHFPRRFTGSDDKRSYLGFQSFLPGPVHFPTEDRAPFKKL